MKKYIYGILVLIFGSLSVYCQINEIEGDFTAVVIAILSFWALYEGK